MPSYNAVVMISLRLVFIISVLLTSFWSCKPEQTYVTLQGKTMGTYYKVTFEDKKNTITQKAIDSVLAEVNLSMSTYIKESTISKFNYSKDTVFCFLNNEDLYFEVVFDKSKEVYIKSRKAFNPAIMPLVNYYGFGYEKSKKIEKLDTNFIQKTLPKINFDDITLKVSGDTVCLYKKFPDSKIDFSAIAKGYGVDLVASFLEQKNIRNFMVEIGGELITKGVNDRNESWVVGISRPSENAELAEVELLLSVSNVSMATSGNYRNFYESKGQKFAHIIDPFTGQNRPTDILSTTVIAPDCMTADAYATAFMVLGLEQAMEVCEENKELEACFIYDLEGDGVFEFKMTSGFKKYMLNKE
ncbi:MAG: FAD:protein FMN transferase [Saprospiraceae bacterium]|nr:FAD:protein FMN transferase [Saprospiraceae bacterium]